MVFRLPSKLHPLVVLLLVAPLFLLGLHSFPIIIVDEARNAQAAWEMYQAGEWIVPTFNTDLRADKPPFHYWSMRLFYAIGGKSELMARLGSALCGILSCWLLFAAARKYWSDRAAYLTVFIYALSFYVPLQFHLATPDPYLTFLLTASLLALYEGTHSNRPWWNYTAYALLGLATLCKGPVAPLLAGGSWFVYLFLIKGWKKYYWPLRPFRGIIIWALVAVPWFLAVHQATNGAFTDSFFLDHNFGRFLAPKEGHKGPFLLVPAIVLLGTLPFGLWALRTKSDRAFIPYCWSIVLTLVLFFGFSSTKLPSYPFPAFAFFALIAGYQLDRMLNLVYPLPKWPFLVGGSVLMLLPLGFYFGLQQDRVLFAEAANWYFLLPTTLLAILSMLWVVFKKSKGHVPLLLLALGAYLFQATMFAVLMPKLGQYSQVRQSINLLEKAPEVVALGRFSPANVYYLSQPIIHTDSTAGLRALLQAAPDATLVLTAERYRDRLPSELDLRLVFRSPDLFEHPTTLIYEYHAQ